jgi:4a-hydroxytetrahydrobiopterin dehydratase
VSGIGDRDGDRDGDRNGDEDNSWHVSSRSSCYSSFQSQQQLSSSRHSINRPHANGLIMSTRCAACLNLRILPPRTLASSCEGKLFRASSPAACHSWPRLRHSRMPACTMSTGPAERKPTSPPVMEHNETSPPSQESRTPDPAKPTIEIPIDNKGTLLKRNLTLSSAVKDPSKLIAGLSQILHHRQLPSDNPQPTSSTESWMLEPTGDTITRVFVFETEEQAFLLRKRISEVSDEMDHHASMRLEPGRDNTRMTVTCTTHRPAGLSMRDIRLARRVNELADAMGRGAEV